jgi:type I restriction enzyme M protein
MSYEVVRLGDKEVEHTEVEYEAPELILDKIEDLEKEIQLGLAELRAMLRG